MNETNLIDYLIYVQLENMLPDKNDWRIVLNVLGEEPSALVENLILNKETLVFSKQIAAANTTNGKAYVNCFKIMLAFDMGKIKQIQWVIGEKLNGMDGDFFVNEVQLEIPSRNQCFIFPVENLLNRDSKLILRPNLKPGEIGSNYLMIAHFSQTQTIPIKTFPDLKIQLQIIGERGKTHCIPLNHVDADRIGETSLFNVCCTDVGRVTKLVIRTTNESSLVNWHVDVFDVKSLSNNQTFSFLLNKALLSNQEIILDPKSSTEIVYEVILRINDIENSKRFTSNSNRNMTDVYLSLHGVKGSTKKTYLNNYEVLKVNHDFTKEKHFEFKSEDVGKITTLNVSLNDDDNPLNFIFIDFIEIKIPSRSEAYKFPIERLLGTYFEDGKVELDLEVWKHPERPHHIDYEVYSELSADQEKQSLAKIYLIIHGDHGRTGKIELNDGTFFLGEIDNFEFTAPDVGKIIKLEIFFLPLDQKTKWNLESIQVKVNSRTEAYKFPVHCRMDSVTNFLELMPWKKPTIDQTNQNINHQTMNYHHFHN